MISPRLSKRVLTLFVFLPLILWTICLSSWAQEPINRAPAPPAHPVVQRPVKPPPPPAKPATAHVQPQVHQQQAQRQVAPPPRKVQGSLDPAAGILAQGRGAQSANQTNRVGTNSTGGVHPQGTPRGGTANMSVLRMPPNARSAAIPGGGTAIAHPDGRRWVVDGNNQVRAFARPGLQATYNPNGKLSSVHYVRPNDNLVVTRTASGARQALAIRPGGVIVVTSGPGQGFVQRPIPGRPGYFARSSLVNGRPQARVYRLYNYRGAVYVRDVPATYYSPQFYSSVQNPWPAPVAYNWGSQPASGMSNSAGYFTPAASYASASAWLTDYVLTDDLKTAPQNQQGYTSSPGNPAAPNGTGAEAATAATPVTPQVKDALAQEVQAQIADEQAASQSDAPAPPANPQSLPPALEPNQRTFVVAQSLDVPLAAATCALSPGDVIERTGDNLLPGNKVAVSVTASKPGECPAQTSTQIDLLALQEMQNRFREQVDAGLRTLASSQGRNGLPPGPAADPRPSQEGTAPADRDVATTLAQAQTDADQAEAAAAEGASAVGAAAPEGAM